MTKSCVAERNQHVAIQRVSFFQQQMPATMHSHFQPASSVYHKHLCSCLKNEEQCLSLLEVKAAPEYTNLVSYFIQ